jgi:hypothetical protein
MSWGVFDRLMSHLLHEAAKAVVDVGPKKLRNGPWGSTETWLAGCDRDRDRIKRLTVSGDRKQER